MGNLTFAVAGNGPANNENIVDLLNDWLGFGEKDAEGYYASDAVKYDDVRLILPLTDEQFTSGVAMVHRWSALANLGFVGVISSTTMPTRRDVKGAKGEADDLLPAGNVFDGVLDLLAEADPGDDTALLVLMEDTDPDEETRALVEHAFERGITTVLNLSYGLAPLEPPTAPEPEPQTQESGYAALAASQDAEDAAYAAAVRARREPTGDRFTDAFSALTTALWDCFEALVALDAERAPKAPQEPVQAAEPVTVEKPAGKTRTEFFDEESGEWKPKGRGRPRKGVQLREVPVED